MDEKSDTQAFSNTNQEKGRIERMKPGYGANGTDCLKAKKPGNSWNLMKYLSGASLLVIMCRMFECENIDH